MPTKAKSKITHISPEVGIVETIIDDSGKTIYAIFKDGKVKFKNQIVLASEMIIEPPNITSSAIKCGLVTLPPKPIKYGTEQDLLREIKTFISSYFFTNKGFCEIAALYVMLTWVYERFNEIPYLRVIGTFGTGKSRFLKTMSSITYNSISLGSSSIAAMFRTIDQFGGTFILDEADFKSTEFSSDVAKILNNGHMKGSPVARMREKADSRGEFSVDIFQVFCPKILASRESFNDNALESRCFTQRLYPNSRIDVPISLNDQFVNDAKILRGKLLAFRFLNYHKINIKEIRSDKINNLRIKQIAQPLWNIALLVNNKTARRVIEEALLMDQNLISSQADTQEADVVIAIMKLLDTPGDKIHMKEIAEKYNKLFGSGSLTDNEGNTLYTYDYRLNLSDRRIGEIVGKTLHLRKLKNNRGIYIPKDGTTRLILKCLCERYGVTDDLIKDVNKLTS